MENIPHIGIDQLCINTIRTISMDAVQQAIRGIPELPWLWRLSPIVFGTTSSVLIQRIPSA